MFCRKCGKTIPDDSVFCPYCGGKTKHEYEPISVETPAEREHGYCSNCGESLPSGKLTGLCNACFEQMGYDPYVYGKCDKCGAPLEADDQNNVCKNCFLDTEYSARQKAEEKIYLNHDNGRIPKRRPKTSVGAVVAISLVFIVFIGFLMIGSYANNPGNAPDTSVDTSMTRETFTGFSNSAAESQQAPSAEKVDLELLNDSGSGDSVGGIHITGTVKNHSSKTFRYVQIQYALYDKDNNQVGNALANTNGLEPGSTWKFDAVGIASNVSSYKAIDLSGY
nr:MAG TPA: zinc-ribbon domain protein [Caudoviricetes sp.]